MFDETTNKELQRLVAQLQITASGITFREKHYAVTPENIQQGLVNILYAECYALKETYQNGKAVKQAFTMDTDHAFLQQLSTNNNTRDRWEPGWQISNNYGNGYVKVTKNGNMQVVSTSALQGVSAVKAPQAGQVFTVFFPKEDRLRQPTFYYVFGNRHLDTGRRLTRIYWNISGEGAPFLVDSLTEQLNRYHIPFLFKCLSHPSLYFRRDAAVLYVDDAMMPIIMQLLPGIYNGVEPYLEEDVPLFTFKYKKGIGIAENPTTQESFGMNRAAALADALMAPRTTDNKYIIKTIETVFSEKGINPAMPYLNKGSKIVY